MGWGQAGDTFRCGEVIIESAYVKLCAGDTEEALFMFSEVQDVAISNKDEFLSQVRVVNKDRRYQGEGHVLASQRLQITGTCHGALKTHLKQIAAPGWFRGTTEAVGARQTRNNFPPDASRSTFSPVICDFRYLKA